MMKVFVVSWAAWQSNHFFKSSDFPSNSEFDMINHKTLEVLKKRFKKKQTLHHNQD